MRSLVKESQSAKFASTVNREHLESLVKNIRDEVNTISSATATNKRLSCENGAGANTHYHEHGSNMLAEYKEFEMNFKKTFGNLNQSLIPRSSEGPL